MSAFDPRRSALTSSVGDSRAYLQQLGYAGGELGELASDDLALVLLAIEGAEVAVRAVNEIATARLKVTL